LTCFLIPAGNDYTQLNLEPLQNCVKISALGELWTWYVGFRV